MDNKKLPIAVTITLVIGLALGWTIGKSGSPSKEGLTNLKSPEKLGSCSAGGSNSLEEKVLKIDERIYTFQELPDNLKHTLFDLKNDGHQKSLRYYEEFALRVALAKNLNKEAPLPPMKDLMPEMQVSDQEIKDFFEKNKNRMPPNSKLETMKANLSRYLKNQKLFSWFEKELKGLKESGRLEILAKGPSSPKINMDLKGLPSVGPKNASFTLIEASDYLCPHCQTVHKEVKNVLEKYKDKLKFVQVNYALRPNQDSGTYIRGAHCAQKQSEGLFWKYHHLTFERLASPEAKDAKESAFNTAMKLAKEVGADEGKFKTCLTSENSKTAILANNDRLSKVGVHSTPTFFLNNKRVIIGPEGLEKALEKLIQ
mgnify:CR=1 FL=1